MPSFNIAMRQSPSARLPGCIRLPTGQDAPAKGDAVSQEMTTK
jgi:hypothetical protein